LKLIYIILIIIKTTGFKVGWNCTSWG